MLSLSFYPFPVLETKTLILRCLLYDDAPELLLLRSDKKVLQYLDRDPMTTLDEINEFTGKILDSLQNNEAILWAITLKENPAKLIGTIGFWKIVKEHYRAEIGYMLNPAHWNKGIMKEAVKATVEYAFTKTELHSIEANIHPSNEASGALLRSCGFVQEGHFKENYYHNGIFGDSIIFSLVNKK